MVSSLVNGSSLLFHDDGMGQQHRVSWEVIVPFWPESSVNICVLAVHGMGVCIEGWAFA